MSGKKSAPLNSEVLPVEFLNEVSVFETLRVYHGKFFKLSAHLKRLLESCLAFQRTLPFKGVELESWLKATLKESRIKDAMFRVSVHWAQSSAEGRLVALIRPFKAYPQEIYDKGVTLKTTTSRRWTLRAQDPQIKSSQYVPGVLSEVDRSENEADIREFIFLDQSGFVAEGTVSNLFIVKGKRVLTPATGSGILRGISRGMVIEIAQKFGFEVVETFLTRHEIYSADECFMTNTSSEVLPVVNVDERVIGTGKPGPVSKILRKKFKKAVKNSE